MHAVVSPVRCLLSSAYSGPRRSVAPETIAISAPVSADTPVVRPQSVSRLRTLKLVAGLTSKRSAETDMAGYHAVGGRSQGLGAYRMVVVPD